MPETSMLTLGREWLSESPQAVSVGQGSSRISPWGVLPEGILHGHRLVCQHCTLLGARANVPTRFVLGLRNPGHSKQTPLHQARAWSSPGCQTIPPPQHPTRAAQPVPLFNVVAPLCPHTRQGSCLTLEQSWDTLTTG